MEGFAHFRVDGFDHFLRGGVARAHEAGFSYPQGNVEQSLVVSFAVGWGIVPQYLFILFYCSINYNCQSEFTCLLYNLLQKAVTKTNML